MWLLLSFAGAVGRIGTIRQNSEFFFPRQGISWTTARYRIKTLCCTPLMQQMPLSHHVARPCHTTFAERFNFAHWKVEGSVSPLRPGKPRTITQMGHTTEIVVLLTCPLLFTLSSYS